jgi:hypothetical protein
MSICSGAMGSRWCKAAASSLAKFTKSSMRIKIDPQQGRGSQDFTEYLLLSWSPEGGHHAGVR